MPEVLNCCIKLFADDANLYSPIKEQNDRIRMQVGLKIAEDRAKLGKNVLPYQEMQISSYWKKLSGHTIYHVNGAKSNRSNAGNK